jgi:glycosyltransferase involved in cell wall biosynthesis
MKYYLDPNENPPFPKFDYQMQALKNLGYSVYFLGIRRGKILLCHDKTEKVMTSIPLYKVPGIGRLSTFHALYRAVRQLNHLAISFSIAYIRLMPALPPMRSALRSLKKSGCKLVMEIPTYPPEQEELTETRLHRKLFFKLSKHYEHKVSQELDMYTLIGKQRADSYRGIPAINITNGISLDSILLRTFKKLDEDIHLLAVANIQVMNGFDRVIEGISLYYSHRETTQPDIHFHIVGPDRDGTKEKLQQLVIEKELEQYIHFEGPAFGPDLEKFFSFADVAVGSMGLHRIGHTGIATLKAREYLAHGIPYIHAGTDPVIPQDRGWSVAFPQDDSPIDMATVMDFIKTTKQNKSIGLEMRRFAQEQLSWETQFEQVFKTLGID